MANNAYFEMHVKGQKPMVDEFVRAMERKGEYAYNGVGRIFSCDVFDDQKNDDGTVTYSMSGDCAWSILIGMRDREKQNNIERLSDRLGLEIEAYSEEYGIGFQEHVYINHGEVEVDECEDAREWSVECERLDDDIWSLPEVEGAGITQENYMDYVQDGWLKVGGFEWDFDHVRA